MKKKWWIAIIIAIIVIAIAVYLLFINKTTMEYFGFNPPDFSSSARVGDDLSQATNTNAWKDAALNPFRNNS